MSTDNYIYRPRAQNNELCKCEIPLWIANKLADYGTSIDLLVCRTEIKEPYPYK